MTGKKMCNVDDVFHNDDACLLSPPWRPHPYGINPPRFASTLKQTKGEAWRNISQRNGDIVFMNRLMIHLNNRNNSHNTYSRKTSDSHLLYQRIPGVTSHDRLKARS